MAYLIVITDVLANSVSYPYMAINMIAVSPISEYDSWDEF